MMDETILSQELQKSEAAQAEMGPKAVDKMMEWGLEPKQIKDLREITGEYDYDSVVRRLDQMTKQDIFLALDQTGEKYAVIPDFYKPFEGNSGNCTELSFKLATSQKFKDWVRSANETLAVKGKQELEVYLCSGQADEFFTDETEGADFHQWVGIRPTGQDSLDEMIDIDPALGSIHSTTERNYKHTNVAAVTPETAHPRTEKFKVGQIGLDSQGNLNLDINNDTSRTLGLSSNGRFSYNLGFLESEDSGELVPLLTFTNNTSLEHNMFFIDPFDGTPKGGAESDLSPDEIEEIKTLLETTQQFRINRDISKYPYPINTQYLEDQDDRY